MLRLSKIDVNTNNQFTDLLYTGMKMKQEVWRGEAWLAIY